jgi:hypothetical protein
VLFVFGASIVFFEPYVQPFPVLPQDKCWKCDFESPSAIERYARRAVNLQRLRPAADEHRQIVKALEHI